MFKKKTVFILGAGASWHYGYPTGEKLVQDVRAKAEDILAFYWPLDGITRPRGPDRRFHPENFSGDKFDQFIRTLKTISCKIADANPLVIDDFLGRNDDIAQIGKLLIAMVLLGCEKKAEVRSGKIDHNTGKDVGNGDWVRYIVQQLTVDCNKPEDLLANQVTFVTFNYDLSLEKRLSQALANYQWFAGGGNSVRFFAEERFLHVYGKLYDFAPAQPGAPGDQYSNRFPLANEIDQANDAANNIRTIAPDEKVAAPEIVKAIGEAEYLYFLGYGFDRRNNELLGLGKLSDMSKRQYVNFTNYGNLNRISKSVERIYAPVQGMMDNNGRALGSLLGNSYMKRSYPSNGVSEFHCEKSINSVYDALARDFDWPECTERVIA